MFMVGFFCNIRVKLQIMHKTLFSIILVLSFLQGIWGQRSTKEIMDSLRIKLYSADITEREQIKILNRLTFRWSYAHRDSANYYLNKYKVLVNKLGDRKHLSYVARFESLRLLEEGNIPKAIHYDKYRIELGLELGDYSIASNACSDLGNGYLKIGNLDSALIAYELGLNYATKGAKITPKARALINIGELNKIKGNYLLALLNTQKALDLCLDYNLIGFLASTYNLLGEIYLEVEDIEKAKKHFKKAIEWAIHTNNKNKLAISYEMLAKSQIANNQFDLAEQNLKQSIIVGAQSKINNIEGRARWKLADLYRIQHRNEAALEMLEQSLSLLEQNNDSLELINALVTRGFVLNEIHDFNSAKQSCLQANEINKKTGQKINEIDLCQCLYSAYKGTGEYQQAVQYLESYTILKDSVMNFSISREITQLEEQKIYEAKLLSDSITNLTEMGNLELSHQKEVNQQQRYIFISIAITTLALLVLFFLSIVFYSNRKKKMQLETKNQLIENQKEEISSSLNEKEILLKEIHHRVKNNLQIISGLLELQSNILGEGEAANALLEGQARVKSMALIHQKLYQTDNLALVNMKDYTYELTKYLETLFRKEKKVAVNIDIINIKLDIDTAIPLGLIINELFSNAFKYAFDLEIVPTIHISIQQLTTGVYELRFSDNGKGLESDFDVKLLKSLGLKLVRRLTQQLFGRFEMTSKNGLHFLIQFKDTALRKNIE